MYLIHCPSSVVRAPSALSGSLSGRGSWTHYGKCNMRGNDQSSVRLAVSLVPLLGPRLSGHRAVRHAKLGLREAGPHRDRIVTMASSSATPSALPSSSAADAVAKLTAAPTAGTETGTGTEPTAAEAEAEAYERTHVHGVYEAIAPHFSATRYKPWPAVGSFLRSRAAGAVGLDVGCGNGKYLGVNPDVFMLGSDRSPSLIALARDRCMQLQAQQGNAAEAGTGGEAGGAVVATDVLVADGLLLPFRERAADFVICVAVIHHMSTRARRQEAIRQLLRCVRLGEVGQTGGQVLVYVWALEQNASRRGWDEGGEQDLLVPWVLKSQQKQPKQQKPQKRALAQNQAIGGGDAVDKGGETPPSPTPAGPAEPGTPLSHTDPVFQRYYHLYRKGELEEDVLAAGGVVVSSGYERDNWWVVAANEPVPQGQQ
ncbi:S-adenosyl-L-methionine-dependent methyltransferase [Chaetomium fimeti]|uniref:S-adenosyl-L-methionine-dependent methyltransferase n=1 Tax=Chaetomium fimeti TaxID=1854472 RepID=A0AAE0HBF5_9PEZI|nr:S-adenosyl-L-methionine-dependent methyltransferase [Chaetomium fimeti]